MSQIPWLHPVDPSFPAVDRALSEPNGLLAVGGDLSTPRLLNAYQNGIFPWYEDDQPILWWSPDPRAVLFPDKLRVSRTLRKQLRRKHYQCTADLAFDKVITGCSSLNAKREGTWITDEMRVAYQRLHQEGWAHSVEVWQNNSLIGGLYGIAMGKIFFGESMFSRAPDASKIALVALCEYLCEREFKLIDCQVGNPYLFSMGAEEIPRLQLQEYLATATTPRQAERWQMDWRNMGNSDKMRE